MAFSRPSGSGDGSAVPSTMDKSREIAKANAENCRGRKITLPVWISGPRGLWYNSGMAAGVPLRAAARRREQETMASVPTPAFGKRSDYPTSDGRPMAETDQHRDLMVDLIQTLRAWYAGNRSVYVSGNLLMFFEQGNRRRHISPDVF